MEMEKEEKEEKIDRNGMRKKKQETEKKGYKIKERIEKVSGQKR